MIRRGAPALPRRNRLARARRQGDIIVAKALAIGIALAVLGAGACAWFVLRQRRARDRARRRERRAEYRAQRAEQWEDAIRRDVDEHRA